MTNRSTEGNFANTLLGAGYSSCEVCFNVKLKRKGIMKWLEDKKLIKPKTEGFALKTCNSASPFFAPFKLKVQLGSASL